MLVEEIWQIAKGFVEVHANLLKSYESFEEKAMIIPQCGKHNVIFSTMFLFTILLFNFQVLFDIFEFSRSYNFLNKLIKK